MTDQSYAHDTYLRCTVCGRTSTASFASSLRHGWEKCCGYTMSLESTTYDLDGPVLQTIGAQPLPLVSDPGLLLDEERWGIDPKAER